LNPSHFARTERKATVSLRNFAAAALVLAAATAFAQPAPAQAPASAMQGCGAAASRHDHGAERNVPTPQKPCKPGAPKRKAKASHDMNGHDHGQMHKTQ
jgi:hypothetical protein